MTASPTATLSGWVERDRINRDEKVAVGVAVDSVVLLAVDVALLRQLHREDRADPMAGLGPARSPGAGGGVLAERGRRAPERLEPEIIRVQCPVGPGCLDVPAEDTQPCSHLSWRAGLLRLGMASREEERRGEERSEKSGGEKRE